MKIRVCFSCFALFLAMSSPVFAEDVPGLAGRLAQVGPHPRLFFSGAETAGMKAKIEGDPLLSAAYGHLVASADALMDVEPVKREKIGKRLLSVSRTCLQRVSYLAFAYRMTGEQRYLDRAKKEMLAAAAFSDWNPSHFLDVAELSAALGIGYDWLYRDLDPDSRKTIRDAIVEKGLKPSSKGGGWVTTSHNWNQVCHGGTVVGALAVLEDEPELAASLIERAIDNVPYAMREYGPDGVYPEGPTYWNYGTTYNVILLSALESALGSDFGLTSIEGFMKTPEFYIHAAGPTGLFFNYSDCGARGGIAQPMHWFARRLGTPSLLWQEKKALEGLASVEPSGKPGGDRMLVFLLIWGRPLGELEPPQTLCWKGGGRTPVAMFRTAWRNGATFVAVKGGSPSTNHAHMDTGSFVLDMKGVRWALDLGAQGYHGLESKGVDLWNKSQNSERWTVFRLSTFAHNTLVVDGQQQRVDGKGEIVRFSDEEANPFAVVDMGGVYQGQLARAVRGVRLIGESVLVQDEIESLDRATSVRWAMATHADVTTDGRNATLRQDGQTVSCRVLSPENAKFTVIDIENPPRDYDEKNPNTRMLTFEASLPASTTETLAVSVEPAGASAVKPALEPLKSW